MVWQILGAFVAITGISYTLEIPRKYLILSGGIAASGWLVYLLVLEAGQSIYLSNFIAAVMISILAQILARILKTPVTVFQIAGIMPLVPGAGMYRVVYSMIYADNSLVSYYLSQTLQIAGVISIAIFLVDAVFRLFVQRKKVTMKQ